VKRLSGAYARKEGVSGRNQGFPRYKSMIHLELQPQSLCLRWHFLQSQ
jgi:hypothetical protein